MACAGIKVNEIDYIKNSSNNAKNIIDMALDMMDAV
jgi:hypothetical protein